MLRLMSWIVRYPLMVLTGIVCWVFMHLFNRTIVVGRHNMPRHGNVLVLANHCTMIDSWWISMALTWPWILWHPQLLPFHLPEEKNFFKGPILTALCKLWRCIPITRGSGNFATKLPTICAGLRHASIIVFPQGTRDRTPIDARITTWHASGITHLIRECQPTIVPVGVYGMHNVLPIGTRRPRCRNTVVVVIGEPVAIDTAIRKETMDAVQNLLTSAHNRWRAETESALIIRTT